jgi:ABC-2 type transport system permease protein
MIDLTTAGGLRGAVASEWTKLWSLRSTWWCLVSGAALLGLSALTLGGGTATSLLNDGVRGVTLPAGESVISAVTFAQFAFVTVAMLTVTGEYASGGIRMTLQATPVRGHVLAAKALVLVPVMLVAGVLSGSAAAVAVYLFLSVPPFGGYGALPPAETTIDMLSVGVFLVMVSLMTLGVGMAMRSAAGTLTTAFLLLMGLPLMLAMTGVGPLVSLSLRMPMFAGLAFMDSSDNLTGGPMPYGRVEGLLWLLGWTAVALAAGHAVLRRRDAS